jgi:alanyl-tRNA synthetase
MTWTFKPKFVGYEQTHVEEARICAITPQDHLAESWAVLDPCPFYAESGGQVGDQGYLTYQGATIQVIDTVSPYEGGIAIKIKYSDSLDSQLAEGAVVAASVRREHRLDTQRNHTATHLLCVLHLVPLFFFGLTVLRGP